MSDRADWSQSVSIDAASVTIPVSGTVSITSGTVTIANASIAVINASGTKITSARPPKSLGQFNSNPPSGATVNLPLDSDIQALAFEFPGPTSHLVHFKVAFHYSAGTSVWVPLELYVFAQPIYIVPILPFSISNAAITATSVDVTIAGTDLNAFVNVYEIFESAPLWLQVFPQPQLVPNQFPKTVLLTLAALTAQWVIQSAANVQITLFNIVVMRFNPSVANDDFTLGYSAALPTNGVAPPNAEILIDSTQTAASGAGPMFTLPLAGVQLPRGSGLWADISLSAIANLWLLVEYSLS